MVCVRRVAPVLLLVFVTTAAFAQRQTSQPPRELHRYGDHYTAYEPPDPATYPAGARTHEIKRGDTLWDLAQTYYNNPYLWPQLWESNTWITDAHWIYPGDVLLVEGEGTSVAEAAQAGESGALSTVTPRGDDVFATTNSGGVTVARLGLESRPRALGVEADVYCYGYIGDPNESMPNYFSSHDDVELKYVMDADPEMPASASLSDLIYVKGDATTGLVAGDTYLLVEPRKIVRHPVTKEVLGREYEYVGQARILCTENGRSRAIITSTCREIQVGARLKPVPQLPIPIARVPEMADFCYTSNGKASGYIVESQGWDDGLAQGNLVQIDLGSADQIAPGDFLTVSRPSKRSDQPDVFLGQIGVLTTEMNTATAIVIDVRRELKIGDKVELR
jgi:hypothetical protein